MEEKEMESNSTFFADYYLLKQMVFELDEVQSRNKREKKFLKTLKKKPSKCLVFDWKRCTFWALKDLKADNESAKSWVDMESLIELIGIDPISTGNVILMLEINGINVEIRNATPPFRDQQEIDRWTADTRKMAETFRTSNTKNKNNQSATT